MSAQALDLFGDGFVMLTSGSRSEPAAVSLSERAAFAGGPDGNVAWMGDDLPADLDQLLATVTGTP